MGSPDTRTDPDYANLIRKLALPAGFTAPRRLAFEDLEARAITRADLREDVRGINASIELIRRTRGGGWPTGPVTEEENFADLVWHEVEFRDGISFTYAVYTGDGRYLGCCYLYPMGRRTEITAELLSRDVDVSWWVTPDASERGYYGKLQRALRHWLEAEFPFKAPYYSNREIASDESDDGTASVTITRAVPNIRSDRPAETRDFFVDLLGFVVAMDLGWVVTLTSPTDSSVQVTIIGNEDPAAPGMSVEVAEVDAVHAKAVEQGLEIAYPLRDEEWGVRRFMLREPSGTTVNVLSHRSR